MFNICIIYSPGSYGTLIEWCLNYFSNKEFSDNLPFCELGSSHYFDGNHLGGFPELKQFIINSDTDDKNKIVRFHIINYVSDDLIGYTNYVSEHFRKIIWLHPTYKSILWNLHNRFSKIVWNKTYSHKKNYKEDSPKLFKRWLISCLSDGSGEDNLLENIKRFTKNSIIDLENWQLREFLSLYIYKEHLSQTGLDIVDELKHKYPFIKFVPIDSLRDNFQNTIYDIFNYCDLGLINEEKLDMVYQHWIQTQFYKNSDVIVDEIVESIVNNTALDWKDKNLTILDEAFIQMKLRNIGYEIKCFNLNQFPTDSNKLKLLLYAT